MFKKLFGIIAVFTTCLSHSGCALFKERIRKDIDIHAPRKVVWDILAELEKYPEWNPYHVKVNYLDEPASILKTSDSNYRSPLIGEELEIFIEKPNGDEVELEVQVINVVPRFRLYWGGGIMPLFHGEHRFILESKAQCLTTLRHEERFWGLFLPFVPLGIDSIEQGYELMNLALKDYAERNTDLTQHPECLLPEGAQVHTERT